MRLDRPFAAIVSRWETNLSSFNDEYERARSEPGNLQADRGAALRRWPKAAHPFARALEFRRFLALAELACIVVAVSARHLRLRHGAASRRDRPAGRRAFGPEQHQSICWPPMSCQSGRLKIDAGRRRQAGGEVAGTLAGPGSDMPRSLGVFPDGRERRNRHPAGLRSQVADGATLAVSLEPFGGSPTGTGDRSGDRKRPPAQASRPSMLLAVKS